MLQKSYTTTVPSAAGPAGTVFPDAVHEIVDCTDYNNPQLKRMVLHVYIYEDAACQAAGNCFVETTMFPVSRDDYDSYFVEAEIAPLGRTTRTQGYEYLKSLPQYAGAIDI